MRMAEYLCKYGEAAIKEASIAVLGYPGSWVTSMPEVKRLKPYLSNHFKTGDIT